MVLDINPKSINWRWESTDDTDVMFPFLFAAKTEASPPENNQRNVTHDDFPTLLPDAEVTSLGTVTFVYSPPVVIMSVQLQKSPNNKLVAIIFFIVMY